MSATAAKQPVLLSEREVLAAAVLADAGLFFDIFQKWLKTADKEGLRHIRDALDAVKERRHPAERVREVVALVLPRQPAFSPAVLHASRSTERRNLLESFMLGEVPLGRCTPAMAKDWMKKSLRDTRFVQYMIRDVPDHQMIGLHKNAEMAEKLYRRATNEALGS